MPTLPNMSLITPTLGGDSGTWDDKINAAFELVDSHDHTAGKGVQIPISALNINADLPLAGYGITGLSKATFSAIALPSAGALNLFVNDDDDELYWRSAAGANVQLTSGASINTTLVGGITGDYSTVGAEIAYDDANKRYTLQTQTDTWARLATGPVRIYEYNTTESVYVEHAVDAALAAPYTVTWPAALPATSQPVVISSTGVIRFDNPDDLTHGERTLPIQAAECQANTANANGHRFSSAGAWSLGSGDLGSTAAVVAPIKLSTGKRITGVTAYLNKTTTVADTLSVALYKISKTTGARTPIDSDANADAAPGYITIVLPAGAALAETIASGFYYQVEVYHSAAEAGCALLSVDVTYDKPV